jgi:hypothetical protein
LAFENEKGVLDLLGDTGVDMKTEFGRAGDFVVKLVD